MPVELKWLEIKQDSCMTDDDACNRANKMRDKGHLQQSYKMYLIENLWRKFPLIILIGLEASLLQDES